VSAQRRMVELNTAQKGRETEELRQHLINASNDLYLYELLCQSAARPVSAALKRAHTTLRAELKRLETEIDAREQSAADDTDLSD